MRDYLYPGDQFRSYFHEDLRLGVPMTNAPAVKNPKIDFAAHPARRIVGVTYPVLVAQSGLVFPVDEMVDF
jgi:hypothetical protein